MSEKNNLRFFKPLSPTMSVHKKIQSNRSSRLADYTQHIYECLVLFYRLAEVPGVARGKKIVNEFF